MGAEPAMRAKPRDQPGPVGLDETIDFLSIDESGTDDRPEGGHAMPRTTPQAKGQPSPHRYTFTSGARPLEGFTIKRAIGRGGFGEVYYATSDSGKEVALKLITRNLEIERRGVVQCMNLKCQNLLAIHDIKANESGDTFVVMEYVAGPSLANVLANYPDGMPPAEVRSWLRGLVDGVSYLHDHGIVHRDLKPANLFMEEGIVKIGDYGLSKMITSQAASNHSESIGTCHYMAPEISTGKYNKPIDIYAMGVILYEMITGRVPFGGETVGEVLIKHLTTRPDLSPLPEPFREIIGQALSKDPAHRPARVVDLLPPGDAPRPRDVRFIGEGKVAAPAPPPARPARKGADDDVLRITDEEPVLYIGPDTRPPRARPAANFNPWARRGPRPAPSPRPAPNPARAADVARRVRLIANAPLVPPAPPEPPPPLPTGRLKVAELATSMVWAGPWAGLASLLAGGLMQIDLSRRPQDLGYLFAMTLLASWAVLVANKLAEGRPAEINARRFTQLVIGLGLGAFGQLLAGWMMVEPSNPGASAIRLRWFDAEIPPAVLPGLAGYAAFFGLVALGVDWWTMTDRDRKARFRLIPIAKAALIALIPGVIFFPPDLHPLALPVVVLTTVVVQLSSPWSEVAARYTQATRGKKKTIAA